MAETNERRERLEDAHVRREHNRRVLAILGCMVVFITAFALMVPAISITQDVASREGGFYGTSQQEATTQADAAGASSDADDATGAGATDASDGGADQGAKSGTSQTVAAEDETTGEADDHEGSASDVDSDNNELDTQGNGDGDKSGGAASAEAKAEADDEAKSSTSKMPAQKFKATLAGAGAGALSIAVEAPEGALPRDTTMTVEEVVDENVLAAAKEAGADAIKDATDEPDATIETDSDAEARAASASDGAGAYIAKAVAVNITFADADSNEVEPVKDVRVTLGSAAVQEAVRESKSDAAVAVVHLDDKQLAAMAGVDELAQIDERHPVAVEDARGAADVVAASKVDVDRARDEVAFEASDFSVYAVVYTVDTYYRSYTGDTFKITLDYDASAGIPSGAELKVREVLPGDNGYQGYYDQALQALGGSKGAGESAEGAEYVLDAGISEDAVATEASEEATAADATASAANDESAYARFFDIEIWADGVKVEPAAPVSVKIELADAQQIADPTALKVVHFTDDGPEVIEGAQAAQKADGAAELNFKADSFSVYGAIVTPSGYPNGNDYMVLVKRNEGGVDKYYLVKNDGTLELVDYEDGAVTVDDPMLWHYTGDHIHHNSMQVGYTYQALPSDSYYRYIDPSSATGLSEDDKNNTTLDNGVSGQGAGPKVTSRALWQGTALTYTDGKLRSTSNSNYYLGVEEVNGKLQIKGQVGSDDAAEILFASATKVATVGWQNHTVNHIDIAISGTAAIDVPLAYGKYYDENHEVVLDIDTFTKLHLGEDMVVDPEQLGVTPDDMKRSTINAYLDEGTNLDDAFYVSGYSANPSYLGESAQVRIEGSFKVANPEDYPVVDAKKYNERNWWDGQLTSNAIEYRNAVHTARLENRINYSVTVVKPVEFYMKASVPVLDEDGEPVLDNDGNPTYKTVQLYDADGNLLTIEADVAFSASFDYWDGIDSAYWDNPHDEEHATYTVDGVTYNYTGNECPPVFQSAYNGIDFWRSGGIPDHNLSGMDFKLGAEGETQTKIYAIEITKIVVDENGNRIKSNNAGSNKFFVYKKPTSNSLEDGDLVKDLDVGSFTQTPDYGDYALQHEKSITVGTDGLGIVYDYDVKPALYYIQEDPSTIVDQITDTAGKTWDYKNTYILTEYAWRNHSNDNYMHVSDTFEKNASGQYATTDFSSVPEILGDHYDYNRLTDTQGNLITYTNDFLEFYVYNVYESPKVDVPVTKTWDAFEDDEYDWQATFKLQWAPLYPGEDTPNTSFTDVTPLQTMTINKTDMAGVDQDLIDRYLAGDSSLTPEEIAKVENLTFMNLPKYGTDTNGNTYRIQYSLEEASYRVTNAQTGVIIYSWSEDEGYNDPEESTHYQPFYPHDAGETVDDEDPEANESDANYYIQVRNAPKNIRDKEYIDVDIAKQWDESFTLTEDSYAEFELKRFVHTEYRDLSHMTDSDRANDPVTLTVNDGDSMQISTFEALPNLGLFLGCAFAPHDETKTVTFTANPAVTLANGSRVTTITVTAEGSNASNALVRSQEFFVTQDTTFTLTSGAENLVSGSEYARVLDTAAGSPPLPDRTFSQTIRLDNSNPPESWKTHLEDLVRSETYSSDDGNENVVYYEYYLVEKGSDPEAYAQYFRADADGQPTEILSGDSDHQIEYDDSIIAVNGPSNRLIVKKLWRGVADTTGFPGITFTLYQTTDQNGNGARPYVDKDGVAYEHIELKGHNLEWICPVELPTTVVGQDGVSRPAMYYVEEDVREGSDTEGGITTSWGFYYYRNSNGNQTNAGDQGYQAGLTGSDIADGGGFITICNKMNSYINMDIKKKFFELQESGSWATVTQEMDRWKSAILGFKVIRAVRTSNGKWLDERGNESDSPIWSDYSEEMLCGYDQNGNAVVDRGDNDLFYLKNAGGNWHFEIMNNWGDQTNINAADSGCGLPSYGFYIRNGEDIPVEYWYSYRETNVYKFVSQDSDGTIHVTDYPEWDWFSTVTPENAYGPALSENGDAQTMIAFPHDVPAQEADRISNFQASDLIVDKQWLGDEQPDAKAVYVKVWRQAEGGPLEDFTAIIAEDIRSNNSWQNYVDDASVVDLHRNCLIITTGEDGNWSTSLKVNRALLGTIGQNSMASDTYHYYIQEIGYRTNAGEYRTDVNGRFKPLYDKWVGTADEGSYTNAPVGMNDYESNNITIGAKGENRLKVINRMTPSTSYRVTKSFHGPQSSTGGQSSVTGKYPTDGSKQVVVMLQQRYRYEKTEGDVEYVSADNETWVAKSSDEAANTWTVDWQAAESASPVSVTLPLDKPAGSVLSDEAWYGSATAWSYTWEGLDVKKVLAEDANPENTREVQLYYRAVEVSTPGWFNSLITEDEQSGHQAINDNDQTSDQIVLEANAITNEREDCTLHLDKEWTSLDGTIDEWPEGFVVRYQLEQHYHLAITSTGQTATDEDNGVTYIDPTYSYGPSFKTVDMTTSYGSGETADNEHTQAVSTIENDAGMTITGLPLYGFFTATEADVEAAREEGVLLEVGKTYAVVYTYSAREISVTKNGEEIGFKPQTADSVADGAADNGKPLYKALLTNELVNAKVKKKWNGLTPGSSESATITLYRFKKDLEPEPETTFTYTVNVTGDEEALASNGTVTATIYDSNNEMVGSCTLWNDHWTHDFELEVGGTYHAVFSGDGDVLEESVTPESAEGITEAGSIELTATVNPVASGSVKVVVTGNPSRLWMNPPDQYVNGVAQQSGLSGWNPHWFDNNSGETQPITGLIPGAEYRFQIGLEPSSIEGGTYSNSIVSFTAVDGLTTITLNYGGGGTGGSTTSGSFSESTNYWGVDNWSNLTVGQKYSFTFQVDSDPSQYTVEATGVSSMSYEVSNNWVSGGQISVTFIPASADELVVITATRARGSSNLQSNATRRSALRANASPLRSPASIAWTNDTSGLPEGANPATDEVVDTVVFPVDSNTPWEKAWSNLEKYALGDGECKEYVYYAYESDWTGASGATALETTYSVDENGTMIVTNTPTYPDRANLKVEKEQFYNGSLNAQANGKSFTVGLFTDAEGTSRAVGVGNQPIPDQTITITNGKGETIFAGLPEGTYYVFEIVDDSPITTSGTQATIDGATFTVTYANTPATTTNGQTTTAKVTNDQAPFDLDIVKVDAENNETRLNGAEFTMYTLTYNSETQVTSYVEDSGVPRTTAAVTTSDGTIDGTVSFSGLALGYYEIVETKAPDGYLLTSDTTFCIKVSEDGVQMVIREAGKSPDEWQTADTSGLVTFTATNATATIGNPPGKPLPVTGGPGTIVVYLVGSILVILGCTMLAMRRRRGSLD